MGLKHLSLFAGCGGIDLGFSWAGIETVAAVEIKQFACDTLKKNHSNIKVFGPPDYDGDVRKFNVNVLHEMIGDAQIDIISGGPPCQPFSVAASQRFFKDDERYKRKGDQDEEKGNLLPEYIRIINEESSYKPTEERDHQWGQEIVTLLGLVYPEDKAVKYYLGSVLSAIGNYRGLKSAVVKGYQSADVLDGLFYEFDKANHRIPGKEDEYFFHEQKNVFEGLKKQYFSYSGPTSMGKSFVVHTYIKQQIENGSTKNFAILVPTKALINEVRSSLFDSLQEKLNDYN